MVLEIELLQSNVLQNSAEVFNCLYNSAEVYLLTHDTHGFIALM